MNPGDTVKAIVRSELLKFAGNFVANPYECYTEHGIHALFFHQLYNACLAGGIQPMFDFEGRRVCRIQKEYPTGGKLGKPRRQHWDISVIDTEDLKEKEYDFLRLKAVVEFGLNEGLPHLKDDLKRLSHKDSNVENKYVGHFYRISKPKFSKRDKGIENKKILEPEKIAYLSRKYPEIEIVLAVSNREGHSRVCCFRAGEIVPNTIG